MDDTTRIQVEFPIRDTDHTFTVNRPTDGQMLMLSLSRQPTDGDSEALTQLTQRVFRVVEKLMGPEQWRTLEYRMADEEYSAPQVISFVRAIVSFDWSGAEAGERPTVESPDRDVKVDTMAPRVVRRG